VLLIIALAIVHVSLVTWLNLHSATTNKLISLVTQIFGGILILYSIDSNIGIIRHQNLFKIFVTYLGEFPLVRKSVVLTTGTADGVAFGMKAKVTVRRNPETIDKKLEYLQEQIDDLKRDLEEKAKELRERLERELAAVRADVSKNRQDLGRIESTIEEVSIGGLKPQIFGVLLMLYGAFSGYVA